MCLRRIGSTGEERCCESRDCEGFEHNAEPALGLLVGRNMPQTGLTHPERAVHLPFIIAAFL
jgi:hypothetical protein